jgi:hypothetical protein
MKKLLTLILFVSAVSFTQAQGFRITPMAGYLLGGGMGTTEGDLKIGNTGIFGGSVGYMFKPGKGIEATYFRSKSNMFLNRHSGIREELFKVSADYFLIGSYTEKELGKFLAPFLSAQIGATRYSARNEPGIGDEWMFTASLGGGLNIKVFKFLNIRAEARMLAPMQFGGAGFWCGTGGCDIGLSSYSTFVQGSFTGGLIFDVGGK